MSSVGLEMALAVIFGWGIGYWLDKKYDTDPYLMLVGLMFGIAAGFNGLIRTTNEVKAQNRRDVEALSLAQKGEV